MLTFHGMPFRNSTALVQGADLRHVEKRIVHVIRKSQVIETPLSMPDGTPLPPHRAIVVKVAFDDGTCRMGYVTL